MINWVKTVHLVAVGISLTGFVLRGWMQWRAPSLLRHPLARTVPHVNDTVLLSAGITLLWLYHWSPGDHPWLLAKIVALFLYIGLGAAFFRARSQYWRIAFFIAAVGVFFYIVSVALTKQVWPMA
jgi:uncharacterized membrane protein SirB2